MAYKLFLDRRVSKYNAGTGLIILSRLNLGLIQRENTLVMALDSHFSLETIWRIPARIDLVWLYLADSEKWPEWWPYVDSVKELSPGDPSGIGNVRHYRWSTCLPYNLYLTMRAIEISPYRRLGVEVSGDLQGEGYCDLSWNDRFELTQVIFYWDVEAAKPWFKLLTMIAKPVFIWNHNRVMQQGELGLIRQISASRLPA